MTTLGIIGSGHIGSNVARAAVAAGYDVLISNSRGPDTLGDLVAELGPRATAVHARDAALKGDLVLVAVPLGKIDQLPLEQLRGKVVMDANNYYPQRDGRIAALDANRKTTSELLQDLLPASHVVKAFNSIYARQIPTDIAPAGTPGRRAIPIASNHPEATHLVASFLDTIGYDAHDMGPLAESWRVERDTPTYGVPTTAAEYEEILPGVERVQQV
ncbi:NADPH-dependent F420 reductase [Demequina lignilytica]|uniref:NAD(P)-binding domain-containing protein n=1 Tax=Demequina lignilytica TaxID=3051663 RepID=A0AB35MJQ6_9MICO|nr:NAD(P)-binding domain-containing protein [Demequina sp. SYSU T0a273]MDN4484024.1 NAD(P)-binding domain-containing protein [Demequina sp. SYSU T0a273]